MSDFKKLAVWRKAHALFLLATHVERRMRGRREIALRSQMLRSAGSIPANIVEGSAMPGRREFARFVGYAIASSSELEGHLIALRDLHVVSSPDFVALLSRTVEVRKMLYGLLRALRGDKNPDHD
jgi:four helix bundle protein